MGRIDGPGAPRTPAWRAMTVVTVLGTVLCAATCGGVGRRPYGRAGLGAPDDAPLKRACLLVARLTLEEKVAQLQNHAPAIPRLGIPEYDWWNESLHGVARNGRATVFPQAIGLAATFDVDLVGRVARAIADEAREKFRANHASAQGSGRYEGLTFFAPNVNIFRDPRWGRGQETYGEDPFLTARLAVAYVRGLQGDDPLHLRVAAVAKHFAVHSGPEVDRHRFDARVDAHDLADTYLPQFEALVRDGPVAGIMAAYNRVNGEPCVASPTLLQRTLRTRWGFDGFVVGDCGAVQDLASGHHVVPDHLHGAAAALRAGTDLDCGSGFAYLTQAVRAGLVAESEIDRALVRLFAVRFRLGLFDPQPTDGSRDGRMDAATSSHADLAREAARKSLVLLANNGTLPIAPTVKRIAVVGPLADDVDVLLGNYHGQPTAPVTLLAGMRKAAQSRGIAVEHVAGVSLAGRSVAGLGAAVAVARAADLIVAVLGLSPLLEGEEGDPDGMNPAGDRRDLRLPPSQAALLGALHQTGKPIVVVLTGGGAIALPDKGPQPDAVVMVWYPGEQGGNAVADVLFGDVSPSGRLPVTFYRSVDDLPPFANYAMAGRTYRYFAGKPLRPFGYGESYASVNYSDVTLERSAAPPEHETSADVADVAAVLHLTLENRGSRVGDEVVQVYATPRPRLARDPFRSLVAFQRVTALTPGQARSIDIALSTRAFTRVDQNGIRQAVTGTWDLTVGNVTVSADLSAR